MIEMLDDSIFNNQVKFGDLPNGEIFVHRFGDTGKLLGVKVPHQQNVIWLELTGASPGFIGENCNVFIRSDTTEVAKKS